MQIVILAGGRATRLDSITRDIPKSLVPIYGKPFLEYQLDLLRKGGVTDVVICIGHLGEQIKRYLDDGSKFGVNVKYSEEGDNLLGTGGALKNAESLLENEFMVMYGDSFLTIDYSAIMSYFKNYNKSGLMTVYKNDNCYDKSNVVIAGGLVMQYNKTERPNNMVYIDYGASILRKRALELVPSNKVYSLEELYNELIKQEELLAYEVSERFYQIGSLVGLEEFKKYISRVKVR